jgi:hypothetical protein
MVQYRSTKAIAWMAQQSYVTIKLFFLSNDLTDSSFLFNFHFMASEAIGQPDVEAAWELNSIQDSCLSTKAVNIKYAQDPELSLRNTM